MSANLTLLKQEQAKTCSIKIENKNFSSEQNNTILGCGSISTFCSKKSSWINL